MEFEREEQRHRYRLCRVGFGLIAVGLWLLCINSALFLAFLGTLDRDILNLLHHPWWDWGVGAPITFTTLIGSYLLWGRSSDPVWVRRAALLVIMNFIDLVMWGAEHSEALGLRLGPIGHDWLRFQVGKGLSWAEFILFASMAADMSRQIGKNPSPEKEMAARSLATVGLVFWAIVFVAQTSWEVSWPLQPKLVPQEISREVWHLTLFGTCLLTTVTTFQVAALNTAAFLQCGRAVNQMNQEDLAEDLLKSRSESFADNNSDRWYVNDEDPWK
jgi:hypothetical protein